MPKEVVHTRHQFSGDYPDETIISEVRWSRDDGDYVQLATVRVKTTTNEPITEEVRGGWYIDLDRTGINDLIRYLRRARDQAFGRDE